MSSPTTASGLKRLSPSEVNLTPMTVDDLLEIARGMYEAFEDTWWSKHEPHSLRPTPDIRIARFAKRLKPWLSKPNTRLVIARLASTGEVLGHGGWQQTPYTDGRIMNMYLRKAVDELGFAKREGWTQEEVDEMWEAVNVQSWDGEFGGLDEIRKEEMGYEPHWYLGPLFVFPKWQGQGVGSMLLREEIEIADSHNPPQPMYLEAQPNARPIYEHFGWEGRKGPGRELVMIRRGPRQQQPNQSTGHAKG